MRNSIFLIRVKLLIVITVMGIPAWAQSPVQSGTKILEMPFKYRSVYNQEDTGPTDQRVPGLAWQIYTEREDTPTYTSAGGQTVHSRLPYLNTYWVIAEEGDYIRIAEDEQNQALQLSAFAKDRGWVHKKDVLLWSRSLVTQKGRIDRKAMILNTVDHIRNMKGQPQIVRFRQGPDDDAGLTDKESLLFQFFFVYKITDDYVLLGKDIQLPSEKAELKDSLWGWAPKSRTTLWDSRVAIEPNWYLRAVEERRNGQKAKFFTESNVALQYQKGESVSDNLVVWDQDPLDERPIGEWRRFPVLDKPKNLPNMAGPLIEAGVMGEILLSDGGKISAEDEAKLRDKIDRMNAMRRTVNVVFVIDRTLSMGAYLKPISQAIKTSMDKIREKESKNNINFSAVLYTDYSEEDELIRMTEIGSNEEIQAYLDKQTEYHKNDQDTPEAMYYGLSMAVNKLNEEETNVIILVGDAGNHTNETRVDTDQLTQDFARLNIHFLAIQVHDGKHDAYANFLQQTRNLAFNAAYIKDTSLLTDFANFNYSSSPDWKGEDEELIQLDKLEGGTMGGWVLSPGEGKMEIDPSAVVNNIEAFMTYLDSHNDGLIKCILAILDGEDPSLCLTGEMSATVEETTVEETTVEPENASDTMDSKYSFPLGPGIFELLKASGVDSDQLKSMKGKKYQLFVKASAPMKTVNQEEPLYNYTLLLSRGELADVTRALRKLLDVSNPAQERRAFYETWKQVLKTHVGEVTDKELESKSMSELSEMLFGLPSSSPFLEKVKIMDILDKNLFPDMELAAYRQQMKASWQSLNDIFLSYEYLYGFRSNENPFYWVEQGILP